MLASLKRLVARYPWSKRIAVGVLRLFPSLDLRLRGLIVRAENRPSPLQVDADHLPATARDAYRNLRAAIDRNHSR